METQSTTNPTELSTAPAQELSGKAAQIQEIIDFSNGCEQFYPHGTRAFNIAISEGCKRIADIAGCYWLFDIILSYQMYQRMRKEHFQVWKLEVIGNGFKVTADDGNKNILVTQSGPYTDFPILEEPIKFFLEDKVLMLPTER